MKHKLIRITTVPESLGGLLGGQLNFMAKFYDIIGVSSPGNGLLEQVGEKESIRVIPVEMTRKITPLKDLKAAWLLFRLLKKQKPFIVHSHTPKAGTLGMLAAYFAGVPHRLHTIAGLPLLEATGKKRWLLDIVEKITYKCSTKIYPNSFGIKEIILKNGYTSNDKLKVIGNGSSNGIDTNYFDPILYSELEKEKLRISLGIKKGDFVYIFVGRIVKDKGINELVQAFDNISSNNTNVKLILVGSFEKELDPLKTATESIISTNTSILSVGWQNDVRPYFAISNCLVFPSYREGFPNVVMQAGAMGLKSIVTNINGCNEIIVEGVNGTLILPKDVNSLTDSMEEYFRQVKFESDYTEKCRELIVNRFNQQFIWNAILEEYRALEVTKK